MSIQDSSFTLTPGMDEFDDNETIDGIKVGEMVNLNNSQTDGSMAAGALEEPQNTGYGRDSWPKKSIVHKEMLCITLPDGTRKWKCQWCGALYSVDEKYKSTSNGKKHLDHCLQWKLKLLGREKLPSQSKIVLTLMVIVLVLLLINTIILR
ncbi:hypothetical protein LIER_39905 [Lithospermum erythrorhizon]|uniref:BED-type domain-containing protein n=1 Tax=Lithospermum erythrorhizon TaxID=34254 RepID=A0AAV3QQ13_LITER